MVKYLGRDSKTYYILDKQLKSGGEGVVYTITGKPNSVAKIYKPERVADNQMREATRKKILAMLDMNFNPKLNGRFFVAWPEDALFDEHGVFQGFVMPKIDNMKSLVWATRPSDREALWPKGYRWHYSVAIAFNLSLVIEKLHEADIFVGDMNTNNILIDASGNVTLIDADSFNIKTRDNQVYKCVVGFSEVLPAELQGKDLTRPTNQFTDKTDCFALAVHIFSLLCNNCHPFGCLNYNTAHGSSSAPKIMDNIVKGYCPYISGSTESTVDDALDMDVFPNNIRDLFDRAFHYDATTAVKPTTIAKRPSAQEWRIALSNLYSSGVNTCKTNPLHEYPKTYSKGCPWCAIDKRKIRPTPAPHPFTPQQQPPSKGASKQSPQPPGKPTSIQPPPKKNGWKKFFRVAFLLFILYWIFMYSQIMTAYNENNLAKAMQYINATPWFSQLFPDVCQDIDMRLNTPAPVTTGNNRVAIQSGRTARVEFTAPTSGTYIFTSTGNDDTFGCLYNSATSSSEIISDDDGGNNQNFKIEYSMSANQKVYIGLRFYNTDKNGNITLNISKKAGPNPTPTPAPSITTVNTGSSYISVSAGRTTRVRFVAPTSGTYVFTTTGSEDTFGYLYNSATTNTEITRDDDGGSNQNFKIEYSMSANQNIYIGVKYLNDAKSGTITLNISKKNNPAPTSTPAITTVSTGTSRITVSAGRTTRVKFTAPSSGTYVFTSTGSDDTTGYLYNTATTTSELRSDDDSGTSNNFKIEYSMNANQSIYVGVKFYSSDKSGTISLNISKKTAAWPIGATCRVTVGNGNARSGPGKNYDYVGSIHSGNQFTILDYQLGDTGKDWYKIRLNGVICWISSGLVEVDGHREGTINGVPIQ